MADTVQLATDIFQEFDGRLILGLQGPMGSGKTHFVKALVKAAGINALDANSPSYAIHQQYFNDTLVIHHLDLFRLETEDEVESSGFWDLFYEEKVIIAVEWIDRIDQRHIDQNFKYLRIDWNLNENGDREVSIYKRTT